MSEQERTRIEKIRNQYVQREVSKLDELKALDKKVKLPAKIFGYVFGTIGALVLGTGMCFAMEVIGSLMALGIVIGVLGITMVSLNYPLYKAILSGRKSTYAERIITLSDELTNN